MVSTACVASAEAMGSVLSQRPRDDEKVIACASIDLASVVRRPDTAQHTGSCWQYSVICQTLPPLSVWRTRGVDPVLKVGGTGDQFI